MTDKFKSNMAASMRHLFCGLSKGPAAKFYNRSALCSCRLTSTASKSMHVDWTEKKRSLCRTIECNPTNHSIVHEGLFYTVAPDEFQRWMSKGIGTFNTLSKAFDEHSVMVRKPAIEVMEYLKAANYDFPVIRYILYGRHGAGKSMSLAHIMHYCGSQDWLVLHLPWAHDYNRYFKEVQLSAHNPMHIDLPLIAADWLSAFSQMNGPLLSKVEFNASQTYQWSKREVTEEGTPLTEAIDFGVARAKYACDIVGVIMNEVKRQASSGKFRVLVAVDGVNAMWSPTAIKREDDRKKKYDPTDLTIVQHWMSMLQNDWSGGAVVCTVDEKANILDQRESFLPRYLLGQEGFDHLDPFVPVHVPFYSDKEITSCIMYYIDRKWIQKPEGSTLEGKKELTFLSCRNPYELYRLCSLW